MKTSRLKMVMGAGLFALALSPAAWAGQKTPAAHGGAWWWGVETVLRAVGIEAPILRPIVAADESPTSGCLIDPWGNPILCLSPLGG